MHSEANYMGNFSGIQAYDLVVFELAESKLLGLNDSKFPSSGASRVHRPVSHTRHILRLESFCFY